MTDFWCKACNGTGRAEFSNSLTGAIQGALALYLNEVQPVDGRVQINVSIDELMVLRRMVGVAPAVDGDVTSRVIKRPGYYDQVALDAARQIDALPPSLRPSQRVARIQLIVLKAMFRASSVATAPTADGEARELAAEMIYYSDFHFVGGPKPEWIPGGNSFKQDEARKIANAILALAALPASPLRGRELEGLIDRLDRYDTSDARGLCWEAAAAIRVLTDAAYKNASMKK